MDHQKQTAVTVSPVEPRPLARAMLAVIGLGSAIVGVLSLASAIAGTIQRLRATSLQIDDVPLGSASIPAFSGEMEGATARYSTVSIELQDAPDKLLQLDALSAAVQSIPFIVLSIMLCWLCRSAAKGKPFARISPSTLGISGIAIVILDLTGDILQGRLLAAAVRSAGPGGTAGDAGNGAVEGIAVGSSYGGLFFATGVFLIVLSAVFSLGFSMQRDTENLV